MYSQWSKNIPFLPTILSKDRVTCSILAVEIAPNYSQSLEICPKIYWKECLATTDTTSTRSWHSACLQGTTPADLIGKIEMGVGPLKIEMDPLNLSILYFYLFYTCDNISNINSWKLIVQFIVSQLDYKKMKMLRPWKKKTLFYGCNWPSFSKLGVFFLFYVCLNHVKSAVLGQNSMKNLAEIFWKVTENIFLKFFSKKHQILGDIFLVFKGVIFYHQKEKNI